jgi:FtsZ-binding cell division protein ZapB
MSVILHFLTMNQQKLSMRFDLDADVQTVRATVASTLQIPFDSFWLLSHQRRMDFGIVADYRINGDFSHIIHIILRQDRSIEVHLLDGRVFSFNQAVDSAMQMGNLKSQLEAVVDISAAHQRLIFDGRAMEDLELCASVAPYQNPLVLYLVRNSQALGLLPNCEEIPSPRIEAFLMRSRSPSPAAAYFEGEDFFTNFETSSMRAVEDSVVSNDAAPSARHEDPQIGSLTFANMAMHATSTRNSKKISPVVPRSSASVQSLSRDDDWTKIEDPVKRRQARNRLAAERSRLKKLSRVQELEELLEQTSEEKDAAIAKAAKLEQENRELRAAHRALQEQFLSIQTQLMGISLEQQSKPMFKAETPYTACHPFPAFKDLSGLIPGH